MARSSHPSIAIVNALMLPLGLLTLAAGVTGTVMADGMRWAFALMAAGGVVVMYGGLRGVGEWRRAVQREDETTHAMRGAVIAGAPAVALAGDAVLARWTYGAAEWRAHAARELRRRLRELAVMAGTIILFGGALVGVLERDWRLGVQVAPIFGGMIGVGHAAVAYFRYRRDASPAGGDVVTGRDAVLINGRYHALNDDRIRFGGAAMQRERGRAVLCITLWLPGQYRRHPDELRLPVPPGAEAEARTVADALNRAHPAAEGEAAASLPAPR